MLAELTLAVEAAPTQKNSTGIGTNSSGGLELADNGVAVQCVNRYPMVDILDAVGALDGAEYQVYEVGGDLSHTERDSSTVSVREQRHLAAFLRQPARMATETGGLSATAPSATPTGGRRQPAFRVTCPRFLTEGLALGALPPPLVSISDGDLDRISQVLSPVRRDHRHGEGGLLRGTIVAVACAPNLGPQCRLVSFEGLRHPVHCENLNANDVFTIGNMCDILVDSVSGAVYSETSGGTTGDASKNGIPPLFWFTAPSIRKHPSNGGAGDVPEVLIADVDMDELLRLGRGGSDASTSSSNIGQNSSMRRLHCDLAVARCWTLPPATRAEAFRASCEVEGGLGEEGASSGSRILSKEQRSSQRDSLMKFFQLSASSIGAEKVATLRTTSLSTASPISRGLRLEFNCTHSKLAVISLTEGTEGKPLPPRARVSVLWVPQRRSRNALAAVDTDVSAHGADSSDDELNDGLGKNTVWERSDSDALVLPGEILDAQWHPSQPDTIVSLSAQGFISVFRLQRGGAELHFSLCATYSPVNERTANVHSRCVWFSFATTAPRAAAARISGRAQAIVDLWGGQGNFAHLQRNAHRVLGVSEQATTEEICVAHRNLARDFANVRAAGVPHLAEAWAIANEAKSQMLQKIAKTLKRNGVINKASAPAAAASPRSPRRQQSMLMEEPDTVLFVHVVRTPVPTSDSATAAEGNFAGKPGKRNRKEKKGRSRTQEPTQNLEAYILPNFEQHGGPEDSPVALQLVHAWPTGRTRAVRKDALRCVARAGEDGQLVQDVEVMAVPRMLSVCKGVNSGREKRVPQSRIRYRDGRVASPVFRRGDAVEIHCEAGRWLPGYIALVDKTGRDRECVYDVLFEDAVTATVGGGGSGLLAAWYAPAPVHQHFADVLSTVSSSQSAATPSALQTVGRPGTLLSSHPHLFAHGNTVFALRSVPASSLSGSPLSSAAMLSHAGRDEHGSGGVVLRVEELDVNKWPRELRWRPVADVYRGEAAAVGDRQAWAVRGFDVVSLTGSRQGQLIFTSLLQCGGGGRFVTRLVDSETARSLRRSRTGESAASVPSWNAAVLRSPSSSFAAAELLLLGDTQSDTSEEARAVEKAVDSAQQALAALRLNLQESRNRRRSFGQATEVAQFIRDRMDLMAQFHKRRAGVLAALDDYRAVIHQGQGSDAFSRLQVRGTFF
eukprot:INCI17129.3.p1 GENE.INCI17129.3~~INCI17129.3.p1  ORF type:complete len:1184 (+),score=188.21 INCI17129.3:582-4133(+)